MSMVEMSLRIPAEHVQNIFGQFDQYVKKIERAYQVTVLNRDGEIKILGSPTGTVRAKKILEGLYELSARGTQITEQNVDYSIALSMEEREPSLVEIDSEGIR